MNKKKIIARTVFEQLVDLFSGFFLYLLIWAGAIMGLIAVEADEAPQYACAVPSA